MHVDASLSSSSWEADFCDFGTKRLTNLEFLLRVQLFHLQYKPVNAKAAKQTGR